MITDPLAILVVLAIVVMISFRLTATVKLFRTLGSALVAILLAMLLSNLGILPGRSSTYDALSSTGVSIAIVLILLTVNVRSIASAGPKMLLGFLIGALGTALGALSSAWMLRGMIGDETWKLAGQYTGTYTGGGVNFAALGRALETSSDLFSAAIAADVGVTAIWLIACLSIPAWFDKVGRKTAEINPARGTKKYSPGDQTDDLAQSLSSSVRAIPIGDAASLVALSLGLVWIAGRLAARIPLPEVLILTTLILLLAQLPAVKTLAGSAMLGNYILHLFLAANGAQSVLANIFRIGPAVFYFAVATVAIHGLVIFGLGRAARIDAGTLAVASQANIGGPASAMALASARGTHETMLPGIAVGLLGYAVGNYSGFLIATLVRQLF